MDYDLLENQLNEEAKRILLLIKKDYYDTFSSQKKLLLDNLLASDKVVIVNRGVSKFNDDTLAHGGRTLGDGKIHYYPDVRKFKSNQEVFDKCKRLLPHECFHYFIQPDNLKISNRLEAEIADFYTEGLVEKEARIFYERHKEQITFEKANYGFNINFVNMMQDELGASSYQVIFSEDDYLRNIGRFTNEYEEIMQRKTALLDNVTAMVNNFPTDWHGRLTKKIRTKILQDGNAEDVKKILESLKNSALSSTKNLQSLHNYTPNGTGTLDEPNGP